MGKISTEFCSDEYLHINSCGCQELTGTDSGSLRPKGRIDYHILYIAQGICYVTVNGTVKEAPAGSLICYLPGQRQEYGFRGSVPSKSYYLHFSGRACDSLFEKFNMKEQTVFFIGKSLTMEHLWNQLIDEFHLRLDFYDELCQSILLHLLSVIGRKLSNGSSEHKELKKQFYEVCRSMYAECDKNKEIKEYADACHLSESRFSHLFRELIGVSPKQYLLNMKIEAAKELLKNTDFSIGRISEKIGFQDQNYFSRIFKKYTGVSPTDFKRLAD